MIVDVTDAQARLSELMDRACRGETILISKADAPMVELVRRPSSNARKLGLLAGQVEVPTDFTDEDPVINAMFDGGGDEHHR